MRDGRVVGRRMGLVVEGAALLIFEDGAGQWSGPGGRSGPDAGRLPVPGDGGVVTAATFLVEQFDIVTVAGDERDLDGCAFIAVAGRPVARGPPNGFHGAEHAVGAAVVGGDPELGVVVAGDVKAVVSRLRRRDPSAPALAVVVAVVDRRFGGGGDSARIGKRRVVRGGGEVRDGASADAGEDIPPKASPAEGSHTVDNECGAGAGHRAGGIGHDTIVFSGGTGGGAADRVGGRG